MLLNAPTKGKVARGAAKTAAKHPSATWTGVRRSAPAAKFAFKIGKSMAKRRSRSRMQRLGATARTTGDWIAATGELLATYGPQAAQELGLIEAPKRKRTAPRVAAGVVIGAGAVYFFEPERGRAHREKLLSLVA
jgi:gas vesicle protein